MDLQAGLLRVLESRWFFSRFSRPGKSSKTDMVLKTPWICVWRSLKVLELDFLKRRALLLVEGFWGPEICLECPRRSPKPSSWLARGPPPPQEPHPSAPRFLHLCLYILRMVLESPWKVLEFDFDKWVRTLYRPPAIIRWSKCGGNDTVMVLLGSNTSKVSKETQPEWLDPARHWWAGSDASYSIVST